MRVMVLPASTPVDEAVAAASEVAAVVVLGDGLGAGGAGGAGGVTAALAAAGVRVATFAGDPDDPALAEMVAELFGRDAVVTNLRQ